MAAIYPKRDRFARAPRGDLPASGSAIGRAADPQTRFRTIARGTPRAVPAQMPGYTSAMRAVWLQPDEAYLAQRHRLGHDKKDELWDGVLHMVPPASSAHGGLMSRLLVALDPIAKR